jgi:hypothetical protein
MDTAGFGQYNTAPDPCAVLAEPGALSPKNVRMLSTHSRAERLGKVKLRKTEQEPPKSLKAD